MRPWPKGPLIYEINTWVWLCELSRQATHPLTLASVPDAEWDRIAELGFDVVWLMGVWERSPEGIRISMANEGLLADFHRALPDFEAQDNVGSPYCVRRYAVDAHLGGSAALAVARSKLAERGLRLLLDFVPNHVALDHPWVHEHPHYFIQGTQDDVERDPHAFIAINGSVFACGRDPYFPAWPDVLQLNAFDERLRTAATETLTTIAGQCDGVRCDMAMLLINAIFERTWGSRAGFRPEAEYWPQVISAVKEKYPEFQFIAEAYWDLEWELQQQGFDYCYDKRLYDHLEHDSAEGVGLHLGADVTYQEKLIRFIENHDEPRATAVFDPAKYRAAAVTVLTLPGARLIHEGQLDGWRVRLPVFLGRRPEEASDPDLFSFYQCLLKALHGGTFLQGRWWLCEHFGWPDNQSHMNLVCWCWQNGEASCLTVVNLAASSSQSLVRVPWDHLRGKSWQLKDLFTSAIHERHGDEMCGSGLYVNLPPWGFHIFMWRAYDQAEEVKEIDTL
jgi:hypothetical protein